MTETLTEAAEDPKPLDPVAAKILQMLTEAGPEATISPDDVARSFAAERLKPGDSTTWHRYMKAVRQQALYLARQGQITILRKGEPVDPRAPFRGLIKLALPRSGGA